MIEEIKKLIAKDKLLLGKERTLKALRAGKLEKIYLASNTDAQTLKDIEYYSKLAGVQTHDAGVTNEELGIVCKKPFLISVIGVQK